MAAKKSQTAADAVDTTVPADAVVDPAPATTLEAPSGAIIEDAAVAAVDVTHPAVDANPRANTTAEQNAIDFNDPMHRRPDEAAFVGEGLDASVYGVKAD